MEDTFTWSLPPKREPKQPKKFIAKIPMSNCYVDEENNLFRINYSPKEIVYICNVIQNDGN